MLCYVILRCIFVTNKLRRSCELKLCKQRLFCLCSKLCIAESKVVCQLACTETIGLLILIF